MNESACIVSCPDIVYSSDAVRPLMAAYGYIVTKIHESKAIHLL
jgi:hypothetical protein